MGTSSNCLGTVLCPDFCAKPVFPSRCMRCSLQRGRLLAVAVLGHGLTWFSWNRCIWFVLLFVFYVVLFFGFCLFLKQVPPLGVECLWLGIPAPWGGVVTWRLFRRQVIGFPLFSGELLGPRLRALPEHRHALIEIRRSLLERLAFRGCFRCLLVCLFVCFNPHPSERTGATPVSIAGY